VNIAKLPERRDDGGKFACKGQKQACQQLWLHPGGKQVPASRVSRVYRRLFDLVAFGRVKVLAAAPGLWHCKYEGSVVLRTFSEN
jgi:hypothetical protein